MIQATTLYRPVGRKEMDLIRDLGFRAFPPRLSWQPIFYPVLNESYAVQIARDWNTKDAASGYVGYVTRLTVKTDFLSKYDVQVVGGSEHQEYWIPAEELDEFNANIVGTIEVIGGFISEDPNLGGLPAQAPTADELMKLPSDERDRILERQAEFAAPFYASDMAKPVHERELTAFSALDGEPFYDDEDDDLALPPIDMSKTIYFYREREEPYGCFSNFSKHGFEIGGKRWKTSEHYFQAMKFPGTPHEEEIRLVASPMDAKYRGNDRNRPLRPDWDAVKDDVMRQAVLAKFEQNDEIRAVLLSTGDAKIVEDAANDYYWGCGETRTGKNMLGIILMETREILRARKAPE